MGLRKQLFSNTFYSTLTSVTISFLSFIFWLIVGKSLKPWEYGITSTSINLIIFLSGISIIGLQITLKKLISENREYVGDYLIPSIKMIVISCSLISAFLLLFNNSIQYFLSLNLLTILIIIFGIFSTSFMHIFVSVSHALQNFRRLFSSQLLGHLIKLIICSLLIILNFSYFGPLIAVVSSFFLIAILQLDFKMFKTKGYQNSKKELLRYLKPAFGSNLGWLILNNISYIILTLLHDPAATGIFSIGMLITLPISFLGGTITPALFPIISGLSKNKRLKKIRYFISISFRYILLVIAPVIITILTYPKLLILSFSSYEYLEVINFLYILVFGTTFFVLASFLNSTLFASGRPELNRDAVFYSSITLLLTSYILTYFYSGLGLSLAYFISTFVFFAITSFFLKKHIGLSFDISSFFKIIMGGLIFFLSIYISKIFIKNWLDLIPFLLISLFVYISSLYFLKFYIQEDFLIIKYIISRLPKKIQKKIKFIFDFI